MILLNLILLILIEKAFLLLFANSLSKNVNMQMISTQL